MAIEKELLDRLLADRDRGDVFAKDGLLDELKKALSERILNAELDEHLDGEEGSDAGTHSATAACSPPASAKVRRSGCGPLKTETAPRRSYRR